MIRVLTHSQKMTNLFRIYRSAAARSLCFVFHYGCVLLGVPPARRNMSIFDSVRVSARLVDLQKLSAFSFCLP